AMLKTRSTFDSRRFYSLTETPA
ncbi:MAG: hypothetical protein, partial [Olavius algarvensis Gamma 1 endosymbiont]